jgi:hypothetical protein
MLGGVELKERRLLSYPMIPIIASIEEDQIVCDRVLDPWSRNENISHFANLQTGPTAGV